MKETNFTADSNIIICSLSFFFKISYSVCVRLIVYEFAVTKLVRVIYGLFDSHTAAAVAVLFILFTLQRCPPLWSHAGGNPKAPEQRLRRWQLSTDFWDETIKEEEGEEDTTRLCFYTDLENKYLPQRKTLDYCWFWSNCQVIKILLQWYLNIVLTWRSDIYWSLCVHPLLSTVPEGKYTKYCCLCRQGEAMKLCRSTWKSKITYSYKNPVSFCRKDFLCWAVQTWSHSPVNQWQPLSFPSASHKDAQVSLKHQHESYACYKALLPESISGMLNLWHSRSFSFQKGLFWG